MSTQDEVAERPSQHSPELSSSLSTEPEVAERSSSSREPLKRGLSRLFTLAYISVSVWCALSLTRGEFTSLTYVSWGLFVLAGLLSFASRRRFERKTDYVDGVEGLEGEQQGSPLHLSWLDRLGDLGLSLINLCALFVHLPILLSLAFYYDWHLMGLESFPIFEMDKAGLPLQNQVSFLDWAYFVLAQFLPLNSLGAYLDTLHIPYAEVIKAFMERDEALAEHLSGFGEGVMFMANVAISLLLFDSFSRRSTLKGMLNRHVSAISMSAEALNEHEVTHLTLFAPQNVHEISEEARHEREEALNRARATQRELMHDVHAKQRHLQKFLSVFSKGYLTRKLNRTLGDDEREGVTRASLLEALLTSSTLKPSRRGAHSFANAARASLKLEAPTPLRRVALLNAHLWSGDELRYEVLERAREAINVSSAHCASVESGVDYERLTLAATKALVTQGEVRALSAMIGCLRSPSMLLREESKATFDALIEPVLALVVDDEVKTWSRETLRQLSTLLEVLERVGEEHAEGVELLTHIKQLHEHLERAPTHELCTSLKGFVCDLLLSSVGREIARPAQLSVTFKLLCSLPPEQLAVELWAILSARPLSDVTRRELFEGIVQRGELRLAFTHTLRHALREGTLSERLNAARLFGASVYHSEIHKALFDELQVWVKAGQHGEGTIDVLFEMICALGRLCKSKPHPQLTQASAALLAQPFSYQALSQAQSSRLEVARRYALSYLTPSDSFLSLFAWATEGAALLSTKELDSLDLTADEGLSAEEFAHRHAPALELLLIEQPSFELYLSMNAKMRRNAEEGISFMLTDEHYERLLADLGYTLEDALRKELPGPQDTRELESLWMNAIAAQMKTSPSALGLLLTLSMIDPVYPTNLRHAALRKLKQYKSFLRTSDLGALAHRSVEEWVSMRLISLIEAPETDPLRSSLILLLGSFVCERSTAKLWELLDDDSLTIAVRGQAAKAIAYRRDLKDLTPLRALYESTKRMGLREPIIKAFTQMKRDEANVALISYVEAALPQTPCPLNTASLVAAIKHLSTLKRLDVVRPLYEDLASQHVGVKEELFKVYPTQPQNDASLSVKLLTWALDLLEVEGSPVNLLRAIAKALPTLMNELEHSELSSRDVYHQFEGAVFKALIACTTRPKLNPSHFGDFATALVTLSPNKGLTWVEEQLKTGKDQAPLQVRSQLIAALASTHSERFVELASAHISRYVERVGEQGGFSPSCVNRLTYPYLEHAGRAAIPHLRKLAEDKSSAYSTTIVRVLRELGDAQSDTPWLEELYQEVKSARVERGRVYGQMEAELLRTLHGFGYRGAFSALIELARMDTKSAAEERLQRSAISLLEREDLEAEIFVRRDDD